MSDAAHLTGAADRPPAVTELYDRLAGDLAFVAAAPLAVPAPDVAAFLTFEARLLDAGRRSDWLARFSEDGWFWVPLAGGRHPGEDQGLLLDDKRRLKERVWRFSDPSAWALQPEPVVVRSVTGVEVWPCPNDPEDRLAASVLSLEMHARGRAWSTMGRQVHRLQRTETGLRIRHKILSLPALAAGTPHLAWLL